MVTMCEEINTLSETRLEFKTKVVLWIRQNVNVTKLRYLKIAFMMWMRDC